MGANQEVFLLKRFLLWLDENAEETISIILLGFIVVIMGLQIFMRYILSNSLSWPEEVSRYLFIWFVFLGISYGIKHDVHIKVNIIESLFPRLQKILFIIQDVLFLFFCVYMIKPGINVIKKLMATEQTSPALNIYMYYIYLSLLVGFSLAIIRFVQKYFLFFKGGTRE